MNNVVSALLRKFFALARSLFVPVPVLVMAPVVLIFVSAAARN